MVASAAVTTMIFSLARSCINVVISLSLSIIVFKILIFANVIVSKICSSFWDRTLRFSKIDIALNSVVFELKSCIASLVLKATSFSWRVISLLIFTC